MTIGRSPSGHRAREAGVAMVRSWSLPSFIDDLSARLDAKADHRSDRSRRSSSNSLNPQRRNAISMDVP